MPAAPLAPLFFVQPEQLAVLARRSASAIAPRDLMYKRDVPARSTRSLASALAGLVTVALVCSTESARANGRFPLAQAIESVPGSDGSTIFLRATFGILVSRDAGKTWRWICERALGYEGSWDPPIAVTRDGRLWVGLERGLVSTIDGCTVDTAAELAGETIKDMTTDPQGETLWILTGPPDRRGAIWRRSPGPNAKLERIGLMPEDINPMTIEVAPSKPSRIYVTGQPYGTVRGWLFRSDDGGKTMSGAKNELANSGPLFIAAVDPKEPNRVLLRHLHTTGSTVLVTPDGGKTFKEVLAMPSAMYGFAKSADGLTYWAGSGLAEHGIYQSTDRGEHFERVSNHGVLCLHSAPGDRLFVCENPFKLGAPAIGVSSDQGKTVTAIATFGDIKGAVTCDPDGGGRPDAAVGLCADAWPAMLAQVLPRDAGPDAARDGGVAEQPAVRRSACGCGVVGAAERGPDPAVLTAGLIPLVVWARARGRRGSSRNHRGSLRIR